MADRLVVRGADGRYTLTTAVARGDERIDMVIPVFAGALQIEARPGEPLRRPREIALAMWERGFYVRWGGDTLQFAPPFVTQKEDLDKLFNALNDVIPTVN